MSKRQSASFAPQTDEFFSFNDELLEEEQTETKTQSWFSNAAKYLFNPSEDKLHNRTSDKQFHELMVCVLNGNVRNVFKGQSEALQSPNTERYVVSFLPSHLIQSDKLNEVRALLLDHDFINRRIDVLGVLEATKRHTIDLADLKRQVQKKSKAQTKATTSLDIDHSDPLNVSVKSPTQEEVSSKSDIDITRTYKDTTRKILEAVRRSEAHNYPTGKSINVAVSLSIIAEFLLKAKIMREAISRFKESLGLFQALLGNTHVEVARAMNALAKGYIKTGDEQKALVQLSEAYRIYESNGALHQHDAISSSLTMASLLAGRGDWNNATLKYEEVINLKQDIYGKKSINVAKTINDFAIVLAKHNRMSEALRQYECARDVYTSINAQEDFSFDITLLELNIASIKSKLGNYQGALKCYERGVEGLRLQIQKESENSNDHPERLAAQKRHLVSAMGRIGSMRMKLKDNTGALKAYLTLIKNVEKKSPNSSQMEKARAHVKCATIFRQAGTKENNTLAISHLSQALHMYTILHGVNHKDTKAIGSSL